MAANADGSSNGAAAAAAAPAAAETPPAPGFARFLELSRAFGPSRAFTTAVKLDLFSALHDRPRGATAAQLVAALGLHADPRFRAPRDLFDLLVSVGALERDGEFFLCFFCVCVFCVCVRRGCAQLLQCAPSLSINNQRTRRAGNNKKR